MRCKIYVVCFYDERHKTGFFVLEISGLMKIRFHKLLFCVRMIDLRLKIIVKVSEL